MKKQFWRNLLIVFIAILVLEAVLRLAGFGVIPCYYVSDKYEYALLPDQEMNRFGNYVYINSKGMRSEELRPEAIKILKFGDSVLNGGVATDQSELTSTLLEADLNHNGKDYQVLNVSAGSWGPENAFIWMKEHSDYGAKMIILLFSSHDWQDQMTFQNVVGNTPFYPRENPTFAITDAFYWAYTRLFDTVDWNSLGHQDNTVPDNYDHNKGWDDFINYTTANNIPLLVYHHADRDEFEKGEYSAMGKELEAFLSQKNVNSISGFDSGFELNDYRDEIHPKPSGLAKIEKAMLPRVRNMLKD